MTLALGIDVGTSNAKVVLVDHDGSLLASAERPLETVRDGDAVTQDAEALWQLVLAAAGEVLDAVPGAARAVGAVGCCSQYSSIVPVDGDGRPTAPMRTYFDRRGTQRCYDVLRDHPEAFTTWTERHGLPPVGNGLSLGHLLHILHDEPSVAAATACYLEPMDYVAARLTGAPRATQATMFTAQLCDNRTLGTTDYDDDLCRLAGVPTAVLPPLLAPSDPCGVVQPEVADVLGLRHDVTVAASMNDSHAGALATGACTAGQVGLMIGTTAVVLAAVDRLVVDLEHEVLSMPTPVTGTYLVWAENGVAGKALDHVLEHIVFADDALADHRTEDRFAALDATVADVAPGSGGVLFLPWLAGSMAPAADHRVRGAFVNLSLDTRRAELVRAVLEGIAHNAAWLLPVVESTAGAPAERVVFGGGAARSAAWCQILADVLDRPVAPLLDPHHAIARAVALAALHGVDQVAADPHGVVVRTADAYDPDPVAHAAYAPVTEQFVAAFAALRPIYQTLNR
ncbi:MAG: hypothetical protein KDB33_02030 [Acidimicrobiales bacterium]|nr:hypothetical protein [Acidimicrobiales bacterium]